MKVKNDEEALRLMNEFHTGCTASFGAMTWIGLLIWEGELKPETVYRPLSIFWDLLAWTGLKNSGKGVTYYQKLGTTRLRV